MNPTRLLAATAAAGAAVLVLSGCVAKTDAAATGALTVTSTADGCDVSAATAPSGTLAFDVANNGDQVTEFYLLASDGLRIVGEVENVAPGASRTLTVTAQPGDYFTLCKPGMVGDGVGRAAFSVTGEAVAIDGEDAEQKQQAIDLYAAFVKDQVGQLLPAVQTFADVYESGDDAAAREQFPRVRAFYERIEPIAEALGDLDPRIDYREVDAVAEGLSWTGFHRIEKDLWVPAQDALNADGETPAWKDWAPSTPAERATYGDTLIKDTQELYDYVHSDAFEQALTDQGVAGISNGAIALLDEVATGKISGEEDWWSGTDLYDFAANVEGSKMAFSLVRDFAESKGDKGASLVTRIDTGYADLEAALATHGSADAGFVPYSQLTEDDKRQLTDLINALAEPLSQLTVTVLE
jgi:iron uptake system component EfeO